MHPLLILSPRRHRAWPLPLPRAALLGPPSAAQLLLQVAARQTGLS